MKKIAFLDTVHPFLEEGLTSFGWQCDDLTHTPLDELKLIIVNYQGIVIRSRFTMNEVFLSKANNIEFIARSGAGMENIDVDYCERNNIQLFNAPEGNRNAVGEHALGMLLALFNQLIKSDREVRSGIWDREGNRGVELEGKTIGLIGFGNNGQSFAKKLRGFDVSVIAYDKYKSGFEDEFVKEVSLIDIFEKSDVLSFHIPQNEETKYFGNQSFFNSFLKPIYLINLSRGKIIDSSALINSIKTGKILGACLDVLEFEKASFESIFTSGKYLPAAFKEILSSDKVILSPHVGGWTIESYYKLSSVLYDKIKIAYKL